MDQQDEVGAATSPDGARPPRVERLRLRDREPIDRVTLPAVVGGAATIVVVLAGHATSLVPTGEPFNALGRAIDPWGAALVLAASAGGVAGMVGWARHLDAGRARALLIAVAVGQAWLLAAAHFGTSLATSLVAARALGVVDVGAATAPALRADIAWLASWLGAAAALGVAVVRTRDLQQHPGRVMGLAIVPQVALLVAVAVLGIDLQILDGAVGVPAGTELVLRDLPLSQLTNALVGLSLPVSLMFMFGALETARLSRDVGRATSALGRTWTVFAVVIVLKVLLLAAGWWLLDDAAAWEQARRAGALSWLLSGVLVAAASWWLLRRRRLVAHMDGATTRGGLMVIAAWLAPLVVIATALALRHLLELALPSSRGGLAAAAGAVGLVVAGRVYGGNRSRRTAAAVVAGTSAWALWWSISRRTEFVEWAADAAATVGDRLVSIADGVSDAQNVIRVVLLLVLCGAVLAAWRRATALAIALGVFLVLNLSRLADVLCLEVDSCGLDLVGLLIRPVLLDVLVTAAAVALLVAGRRGRSPIGPGAATGALVALTVGLHASSATMPATAAALFYAGLVLPGAYLLLFDARELNAPTTGAAALALSSTATLTLALAVVALQLLSGQVIAGEDNAGDVANAILLVPLTAVLVGAGLRGRGEELWHDGLPLRPQASPQP